MRPEAKVKQKKEEVRRTSRYICNDHEGKSWSFSERTRNEANQLSIRVVNGGSCWSRTISSRYRASTADDWSNNLDFPLTRTNHSWRRERERRNVFLFYYFIFPNNRALVLEHKRTTEQHHCSRMKRKTVHILLFNGSELNERASLERVKHSLLLFTTSWSSLEHGYWLFDA